LHERQKVDRQIAVSKKKTPQSDYQVVVVVVNASCKKENGRSLFETRRLACLVAPNKENKRRGGKPAAKNTVPSPFGERANLTKTKVDNKKGSSSM
jgi:hypothetical protein